MKVEPVSMRQRLQHIRNEICTLTHRSMVLSRQGNAIKPSTLRRMKRRLRVLQSEEQSLVVNINQLSRRN